jgi:hypothetical protein
MGRINPNKGASMLLMHNSKYLETYSMVSIGWFALQVKVLYHDGRF